MPVPSAELPILEKLITIRNRLTALKKDQGSGYVKASDVLTIYEQIIKLVTKLNAVRAESTPDASFSMPEAEANRVDTTFSDVFQLLSLFFLTIGKSRDAPATFCQLATLKRLLDHMNESGVYTETDLQSFQGRLQELKEIIDHNSEAPEALIKLLLRKYDGCQRVLDNLLQSISVLSPELVPLHQRLVQIRRLLAAQAAKPKALKTEVETLQEELRSIDSKRVDGKFLGSGGSGSIPEGQALCAGILEVNFEISQDILARQEDVSSPLKPIVRLQLALGKANRSSQYDRLCEMRSQLERLVLTHRWTLRETDLYNFQVSLQEIDHMRVDGKFVDAEGNKVEGQTACLYLLRRCYGLIYRLMASSEPISEELMPIANKLSTIKRCLTEISRFGGPYSPRDLYPYALALSQIDSLRKDGKFMAKDGSVPEGQAIVTSNLAECYEILQILREEIEDGD